MNFPAVRHMPQGEGCTGLIHPEARLREFHHDGRQGIAIRGTCDICKATVIYAWAQEQP